MDGMTPLVERRVAPFGAYNSTRLDAKKKKWLSPPGANSLAFNARASRNSI
jgi:hypothetical protein